MKLQSQRRNVFLIIVLLISINIEGSLGDFFSDFWKPVFTNAPKFSSSQLYNIDNIGFLEYSGTVAAFGDFNADKYLDTFFLYQNQSTLQIFLWNIEEWEYHPSSIIVSYGDNVKIVNVVPGDYNYDGALDIMIQYQSSLSNNQGTSYQMDIYFGDFTQLSSDPPLLIPNGVAPTDQVLVLDINGDLHLDMIGVNSLGQRTLWVNNDDSYSSQPMNVPDQNLGPISKPHSNSFVDFNGDCLADLFITSLSLDGTHLVGEIWINQQQNGYILTITYDFPPGTGQITFSDFDGDGDLDMLYPVCWPLNNCTEVNSIFLVYNQQKPVCQSALFGNVAKCRPQNQLCLVDNYFTYSNTTSNDDGITLVIDISQFGGLLFYQDLDKGIPLIIHSGDYNIDGYPDLLISLYDPTAGPDALPHVELWENIDGTQQNSVRSFQKVSSGADALLNIAGGYSAVFVDYGENGIPDIMVLSVDSNGTKQVSAVFNNFYNDAFFFKTLGLNGVCTTMCPSGKKFPDPKPYGVNFPGAIFKFTYSDLSGTTHIQIGAQLYQSSYLSLQTPYNLFGLGRTSNYVDQLFFGLPLNQSVYFNSWVGTIPNSQVVVVPYKPSNPLNWTLELFINPSGIFFWVLIAFFAALILLAAVCFVLYKREKKYDEKLKQDQAHLFSFNAL
ncbi:putative integrin alpha FG-GAP repeat-containing protein [Tieghemostelium lacteum]|uniref:Putative integrin alpha FG-GAP repeat-containing protein n=1 Tax=Tieghemostelium lacteum TaxID=361077 RepID=A0A152A6P6_TIELA|nr:putative integrin alpha FG-GAP repeat-containing protein [Tieghemostelium lacteum]|eukprot:KYR01791.1 putative integrin alpha FG-GAP repeat-containing protein [Tieghemostelium lacteum]